MKNPIVKKYFTTISILLFLLLSFQNCSDPFEQKNSSNASDSLKSGNGGVYGGIQINGPSYIAPGQSYKYIIDGGRPPYTLQTHSKNITVSATDKDAEFNIELASNSLETSFVLTAKDSTSQSTSKTVYAYSMSLSDLYAKENQSAGGQIMEIVSANDSYVVVTGNYNYHPEYGHTNVLSAIDIKDLHKITPLAPSLYSTNENFGGLGFQESDMDGRFLVVANQSYSSATHSLVGVAGLFEFDSGHWIPQLRLTPDLPTNWLGYGRSVSISGQVIAVGAPFVTDKKGRAYIYQLSKDKSKVEYTQIIHAPSTLDRAFGSKIILSSDSMVVLSFSPQSEGAGYNPRSNFLKIHLYNLRNQWSEADQTVISDQIEVRSECHENIHFNGEILVVSCPTSKFIHSSKFSSGNILVYKKVDSHWQFLQKLETPLLKPSLIDPETYIRDTFGEKVSLDKDQLLISAYGQERMFLYRFEQSHGKFVLQKSLNTSLVGPLEPKSLLLAGSKAFVTTRDLYKPKVIMFDLNAMPQGDLIYKLQE